MDITLGLLIILLTVLYVLHIYTKRAHQYWKQRGIPYPEPLPLVGNTLDLYILKNGIGHYVYDLYRLFSSDPLVGFYAAEQPCLLVRDPKIIGHILIKDSEHFSDHLFHANKNRDPFSYYMLISTKVPEWKENRKKLTSVFSSAKLKNMFPNIVGCGEHLQDYLNEHTKTDPVMEVRDFWERYLTDMVMSVLFGINAHCLENPKAEFMQVPNTVFSGDIFLRRLSINYIFVAPRIANIFNLKFIDSFTHKFLKNVFWNTTLQREESSIVRNDVVDYLLEYRKQNNVNDLESLGCDIMAAMGSQFYIASYETTRTALTSILYELSKNADVQQKLRKELLKIKEEGKGKFTYENIQEAPYLNMCLKETLRKYPPLPFLDRRCTKTYEVPGHNLTIQKGTSVYISTMGLQHDYRHYPEPEKFIPERFSGDAGYNVKPFTYLPFGDGPRYCIGDRFALLSMKSTLAHLLTEFEIMDCEKTPKLLKFRRGGFVLHPSEGVYLKIKKIST